MTKDNDFISQNLFEASITLKAYGGVKRDHKEAKRIQEAHGATRSVGHFDVYLIGKEALAEIKQIDGEIRNRHYALTLPWSDTSRVIPIAQFEKWAGEMRDFKTRRHAAVVKFVNNWPQLIEQAKQELNGKFNAANYPPANEVAAKFVFEVDYFAVRRGQHLQGSRLGNLFAKELETRCTAIEDAAKKKVVDAFAELKTRITDKLEHFSDRMHTYGDAPNPEYGKKPRAKETIKVGVFRASTIEGLRDLVDMAKGLNFYDDPVINEVLAGIKKNLTGTGSAQDYSDKLKEDDGLRAQVAQKTDALIDKMSAFE